MSAAYARRRGIPVLAFTEKSHDFGDIRQGERSERVRLYARYGLVGLWSVDGAIGANRRDYSIALYDPYDYRQRSADLGLNWQPSPSLSLRSAGDGDRLDAGRTRSLPSRAMPISTG